MAYAHERRRTAPTVSETGVRGQRRGVSLPRTRQRPETNCLPSITRVKATRKHTERGSCANTMMPPAMMWASIEPITNVNALRVDYPTLAAVFDDLGRLGRRCLHTAADHQTRATERAWRRCATSCS
jgi:hypothetical protein